MVWLRPIFGASTTVTTTIPAPWAAVPAPPRPEPSFDSLMQRTLLPATWSPCWLVPPHAVQHPPPRSRCSPPQLAFATCKLRDSSVSTLLELALLTREVDRGQLDSTSTQPQLMPSHRIACHVISCHVGSCRLIPLPEHRQARILHGVSFQPRPVPHTVHTWPQPYLTLHIRPRSLCRLDLTLDARCWTG